MTGLRVSRCRRRREEDIMARRKSFSFGPKRKSYRSGAMQILELALSLETNFL